MPTDGWAAASARFEDRFTRLGPARQGGGLALCRSTDATTLSHAVFVAGTLIDSGLSQRHMAPAHLSERITLLTRKEGFMTYVVASTPARH